MCRERFTRIVAAVVATSIALSGVGGASAASSWMADFYNGAGAAANVTTGGAVATQSRIGYSGGGISWRVPQRTITPFNINPPSLKMSCGGIDAYLGGYSFVNKAAFVQALRNFGQAAVGYFFELALRSMAPEVAVTLEAINDLAQKVNQFGANSCQMARKAVDSLASEEFGHLAREATDYARAVGEFVDNVDATLGMSTGKKVYEEKYTKEYGTPYRPTNQADAATSMPVNVNPIYWLMLHSNVAFTDDEKELAMSLVGAPGITRETTTKDDSTDTSTGEGGLPSTISFKELIGTASDVKNGTVLAVNRCGADTAECLTPARTVEGGHSTFSAIVATALQDMKDAIQTGSGSSLTADTKTVLSLSSVPIWRLASLANLPEAANVLEADMIEYVAMDAAKNFYDYYLRAIERTIDAKSSAMKPAQKAVADQIAARIAVLRSDMYEQMNSIYARSGKPLEKLAQLQSLERSMYVNLNTQLAANARFTHKR